MSQTPAGWYADPHGTTRWWDGSAWTDRQHAWAVPGPPPVPARAPIASVRLWMVLAAGGVVVAGIAAVVLVLLLAVAGGE